MIKKEAKNFEFISDDEENLSSVYFKFQDGYFIVCRNLVEDTVMYLEMNEQTRSLYSNDCSYKVGDNSITFEFSTPVSDKLRSDTELMIFYNLSKAEVELLKVCLKEIFEVAT